MSDPEQKGATGQIDGGDNLDGGAAATVSGGGDNRAQSPIPVPGSAGVAARPPIRCVGDGQVNPCGAFDADHHEAAAEAGVCCLLLADRRVVVAEASPTPEDGDAPGPVWPVFTPCDADVPGGDGW